MTSSLFTGATREWYLRNGADNFLEKSFNQMHCMTLFQGLAAMKYQKYWKVIIFGSMSSADILSVLLDTLSSGANRYIIQPLSYYQIAEILEFSTFKA